MMTTDKTAVQAYPVYTNSIIKVSIPQEYRDLGKIVLQWSAISDDDNLMPIQNFLFNSRVENNEQYSCSPLNYGNMITAKVILVQESSKYMLEQLIYGPVQIEEGLVSSAEFGARKSSVKFLFGKNSEKDGTVEVVHNVYAMEQSQPVVKILMRVGSQTFVSKFSVNSSLAPKGSLFKFEQNEPNCLGISIYHQMSQFLKLLKQCKINAYSGYYLKVKFNDRLSRDLFITQVMHESQIKISQIHQIFAPETNKNLNQIMKSSSITSKVVKSSQIMARASVNAQGPRCDKSRLFKQDVQLEDEQRKDIIEDIYNILYTPLSNYREEDGQLELCFNDRFFLKKSITIGCTPDKKRSNPQQQDQNDSESGRTVKNDKMQYQHMTFKKKDGQNILEKSKNLIGEDTREDYYKKKIQELLLLNEQLTQKNKKLQEENIRLREENIKMNKPQLGKMIQIKDMIQQMANRLEVLENEKYEKKNGSIKERPQWFPSKMTTKNPIHNNFKVKKEFKQKSIIINQLNSHKLAMTFSPKNKNQTTNQLSKNKQRELLKVRSNESLLQINGHHMRRYQSPGSPSKYTECKSVSKKYLGVPMPMKPSVCFEKTKNAGLNSFDHHSLKKNDLGFSTKLMISPFMPGSPNLLEKHQTFSTIRNL